jgi:CheY-like chemotaxis protein
MITNKVFVYDPDQMIIRLLQGSILGIEPSTQVFSSYQMDQALDVFKHSGPFDLVIADQEGLLEMGGEIHSTIQSYKTQPKIILTTYQYQSDKDQASPLTIDYTLQKPLDGSLVNQILEKLLTHPHQVKLESLSLSEEQYKRTEKLIKQMIKETNCRCVWLCDEVGHVLVKVGNAEGLNPDEMASLLGGGFATLDEAGKALDPDGMISLSYREGSKTDLYSINVFGNILLIIIVDKGTLYNRLGTVWFYARQCALDLNKIVTEKKEHTATGSAVNASSTEAYSSEIDKLFNMDN